MYYKEWLRVRRALTVLIIMAGVALVLHQISVLILRNEPSPGDTPLSLFFAVAGIVATLYAGWFGASLSAENSGHLEIAWTKPVSRNRYALLTMGVDLVGIFAAFVLGLAGMIAVIAQHGALSSVTVDPAAWANLVRFLLLPFAFFGLWQALTASLRCAGSSVVGYSTVATVILLGLGALGLPDVWGAIFHTLNYLNPMVYGTFTTSDGGGVINHPFAAWQLNLVGLAVIGSAGIAIALAQWRKLEA
ncbi:MAG: hypothetical protein M3Z37_06100 [Candidatus Eremiobacteraeota bacterium]|nr:hypothetical protein [Candidatus Eremiobacteraeota bacterium]